MSAGPPSSLRVLIVEDEAIIAVDLSDMIADLGHVVVMVANRLDIGLDFARSGRFDLAILDLNLRGILSFPIADVLRDQKIPFIFASGYGERGLIDGFRDAHVLTKPYNIDALGKMVASATQ